MSNTGEVRNRNGRVLKTKSNAGYRQLSLKSGAKVKTVLVHRLVAAAFIGPCPAGMNVAHGNGDRGDNRVENLRYCTQKENLADRKLHGTELRGERNGRAKLNRGQVAFIRASSGWLTQKMAAQAFGVSPAMVGCIRSGKNWM